MSNDSSSVREWMAFNPAIDLHVHGLLKGYLRRWLPVECRTSLPQSRAGMVGAQFQVLVSPPVFGSRFAFRAVMGQVECLDRLVGRFPDLAVVARTASGVEQARISGRTAYLVGIEGSHCLDSDLGRVGVLAERGVRYICLAHFVPNRSCRPSVGIGANPKRGLSAFGREMISACGENGVIVDLAHISRRGFSEAASLIRGPFMVSHTGVRAVHDHDRNLDDDQIRLVAESGGLVGVTFVRWILGGSEISLVARHLEHVIGLVGDDHVAIGSDMDAPMAAVVSRLSDSSRLPNLVAVLFERGWSRERVAKLLRLNVLRLLESVPPRYP
ncbi:membrane dipeptidase [Candidatus Uhrbacteria bacterium]|nr:membrane dipeptidase [Candidatus Uhrbacteria bacterium]